MTTITGTPGNDTLLGTDGADTIEGLAGHDTLEGMGSYDYLYGQEGNDSVSGGDGDDQLYGGLGDDTLDGGKGNDSVFFGSKSGPIVANLMTGQATGEGTDRLIGIENIFGSDANDHLTGNDLANLLRGNSGSDTLLGGGGNDTLDGGWGNDFVQGESGDDLLSAQGSDTLDGGDGLDRLRFDQVYRGVSFDLSTGVYFELLDPDRSFQLSLLSIEKIEGSFYDDLIKGDAFDNQLFGGVGNDTLYGGAGDDVLAGDYFEGGKSGGYLNTMNVIYGGDGTDTVVYGGSRDQVFVTIQDTPNSYAISYGSTHDLVHEVEKIRLSDGLFDLAELANGQGLLQGTGDSDTISGSPQNDTIEGLGGNDSLDGRGGHDSLSGGPGDDRLNGGPGNDTLDGGAGKDWAIYANSPVAISADLSTGVATGEGEDRLIGIENMEGSQFNDELTGDAQANELQGNGGSDTLMGGGGNDTLNGGWGAEADHMQGGDGDDVLIVSGRDTLDGGAGLDRIRINAPYDGVDFDLSTASYFERQRPSNAYTLTLLGIEQVEGTFGDDVIRGDANNNQLLGGQGNDTLNGGAGDDELTGGNGQIHWPFERNTIFGGEGTDTVVYQGSRAQVYVMPLAQANRYSISFGTMNDMVEGVEKIRLSDGLFDLAELVRAIGDFTGSEENDVILGLPGNDTLQGLAGSDFLYGQDGDDSLLGGDDSDQLYGGLGDDTLDGGKGSDTANYQYSTTAITANLGTGVATGEGTDRLIGIENITGSQFNDHLTGNAQDNWLQGGDGSDTLEGGAGNDTLDGGWGTWADHLKGVDGDDVLSVRGPDTLDGGPGVDRIRFEGIYGGVDVDLANSTYVERNSTNNVYALSLLSIEQIEGSAEDDVIRGDANNNQLFGGRGNDTLYGGAGDDVLAGDSFEGGKGGGFWNTMNVIDGGEGTDTVVYEGSRDQVFVTTQDTPGSYAISFGLIYDLVDGVEKIKLSDGLFDLAELARTKGDFTGSDLSETISGSPGDDTIEGRGGNDQLNGLDGNDSLSGGVGDDSLFGGPGDDTLDGGTGNDWASYGKTNRAITANLNTGEATGAGKDTLIGIENIEGSSSHDHLTGDAQANVLRGNGGSDTLVGGGGNDTLEGGWGAQAAHLQGGDGDDVLSASGSGTLDGGDGRDVVRFEQIYVGIDFDWATGIYFERRTPANTYLQTLLSIEEVVGTQGDDVIRGDANANVIDGGWGSDTLFGGGGDDVLHAGRPHWNQIKGNEIHGDSGTDTVVYNRVRGEVIVQLNDESNSYSVFDGEVVDQLYGVEKITFNDGTFNLSDIATAKGVFRGNDSPNRMVGSSGSDTLEGFGGDDTLAGGLGDDRLDGGAGYDTANYRHSPQGVTVNLSTGLATGQGSDTLINMEGIWGSDHADQLTGDDQDNELIGHDGNDTLVGGGGNDGFSAGAGADSQDGGDGNDYLTMSLDNDTANGGAGWDSASFEDAQVGIEFDLATGVVASREDPTRTAQITLISIEQIGGSFEDDVIWGDAGDNNLFGDYGNDTLYGGPGDDVLDGGAEDFYFGSYGSSKTDNNNVIYGGDGVDTVTYHGSRQHVLVHTREEADSYKVTIGASFDILYGVEKIRFTEGTFDVSALAAPEGFYIGSDQNDSILGSPGNDTLDGGAGNDTLDGGWGYEADSLLGGDGDDLLLVRGPDTLDGGAGLDKIKFTEAIFQSSGVDFNVSTGVYFERQTPGTLYTLTLRSIEQIEGTANADVLTGDANDNQLFGGAGDTLYGGAGDDLLHGTFFFSSKLSSSSDGMSVYGGDGSDTFGLNFMRNQVRVHLGETSGSYEVFVTATSSGLTAVATREFDTKLYGIEKIQFSDGIFDIAEIATAKGFIKGTDQNDYLVGTSSNETLEGLAGNDSLLGEGGNDSLLGGEGDDSLSGGAGADTLIGGSGNDTLRGDLGDSLTGSDGLDSVLAGDGDDLIHAAMDSDTLDGGSGKDKLNFAHVGFNGWISPLSGVDFNLATGVVFPRATPEIKRTLNVFNIEQIEGSPYADVITGDAHDNELFGAGGNDTLYGGDGNDLLHGDTSFFFTGKESSSLNPASDELHGGNGTDTVVYAGARARYFVNRVEGTSHYTIAAGSSVDVAYGVEKIKFSDGTFDLSAIASAQGVYKGTEQSDTITGWTGNDTIEGFGGDDVLQGSDGNDNVSGGGGNDLLKGSWGNDTLDGGAGNDTLDGSQSPVRGTADLQTGWASVDGSNVLLISIENIFGSRFNDLLTGNGLANTLNGNDGVDTLSGGGGDDTLNGGAGADLMQGGDGDDVLVASLDNDTLDGGAGLDRLRFDGSSGGVEFDLATSTLKLLQQPAVAYTLNLISIEQIEGSAGADLITGDANDNELFGGGGNDTLYGGTGHDTLDGGSQIALFGGKGTNDVLYGGAGIDTVVYSGTRGEVSVRMLDVPGTYHITHGASLDTVYEVEKIRFSDGTFDLSAVADPKGLFRGTASANNLQGSSGSDTLLGLAGDDTLNGLNGNDSLSGGDGDDQLMGGLGDDTIDGGAGNDWAGFFNSSTAINANLSTGLATGEGSDTLVGIENIDGSSFNDVLTGNALPNWLRGHSGSDTLDGGAGNDTLEGGWSTEADSLLGGDGDDLLYAQGDDTLDGGAGLDKIQFNANSGGIDFNLTTGAYFERQTPDTLYTLTLRSIEQIEGTANADVLTGDANDNLLFGAAGSDTLYGGAGNDFLDGGFFYNSKGFVTFDELYGGDGNDTLAGGAGTNRLDGGNGFDTAVFNGKKSQYAITREADNTVLVKNISASGLNEVSTLISIEQLKFADVDYTPGQPFVSGLVYHWKSQALLSNVNIDLLGPVTTTVPTATPSASQQIQFKSPVLDAAKGKLTFEVWADSSRVVDAFTFTIKNSASLTAVFTSDTLGPDWLVEDNASESPKNFTVAGMIASGLSTNASGHFKLGTVSFDMPAGTVLPTTFMDAAELNTTRVANASLSLASDQSDTGGAFSIVPAQNGQFEMNVSRAAVDSGNAITAADALAALRIAVGLNPNPDPDGSGPMKALMISPYQIMAADVNKNGQVTSADALAILRMAVRLNSAPAQEWFFVDEKRDFWNESNQTFSLSRSQSNWLSAMHANSESMENHNLVGVLKGDINGSWSAPALSQFMSTDHPSHVSDMARLMGVPTDQWGVPGTVSGGQTFTLT